MPLVHFHYPEGSLSAQQKKTLTEKLTHVLIEIEGGAGADGPKARSISWVMLYEIPRDSWAIGGTFDDTYVAPPGKFLTNIHVPEGALSNARKAMVQKAVFEAVFETFGLEPPKDPDSVFPSIFVMITEWPEGNMGARGKVFGLADIGAYVGGTGNSDIAKRGKAYLMARARHRAAANYPD
jgi:phenylpyruvate tautomerase PptA (4-oxalocrotonate tautomerase family)